MGTNKRKAPKAKAHKPPKTSFVLYDTWANLIMELSDDEAGKLFKGLFMHNRGEEPEFNGFTRAIYEICKDAMDKNAVKYEGKVKRAAEARKAKEKKASEINSNINSNIRGVYVSDNESVYVNGYEYDYDNESVSVNGSESVKRKYPSLDELTDYAEQKGYSHIDCEYLWDYYNSTGWMDIDGEPIKNWKRMVDKAEEREADL